MSLTGFAQCLLLLVLTNGAPILARNLFSERWGSPVDGGRRFRDGRPLLGASKTWRGLVAAILMGGCLGVLPGIDPLTGALVGLLAMLGDLFSSFCKRRLDRPSSSSAPLLDQIPESLLPLLLLSRPYALDAGDIAVLVATFVVVELLLSQLLYWLGIRRRPW